MQLTTETWLAIIIAFVVGCAIGYLITKARHSNVQKQKQLSEELKLANAKLEAQKQQLEQHFEQSANLLSTLAEDYKKLYSHLAKGSQDLLPEENKIEFFQAKLTHSQAIPSNEDDQPKDYSEGSSGILKS